MQFSFLNTQIVDCHIHYPHPDLMPGLMEILDENNIQRFNIVCTPHRTRLSLVPEALMLKAQSGGRVFVFGGLDISAFFMQPQTCGQYFADYVEKLAAMGCDGIKMIEGKPDMRRMMPIPNFDDPVYEPYWKKMETLAFPLIFHVNDPEEFWDAARIPDWAMQQGWFYGDGTYINNEKQYGQVIHVMEKYAGLKVVFAHFFFLSAQLERLAGYFDRFPNMHVDLTPGIEMYHNFAENPEKVRDFFIRYQDRILYGTDIGAKALLADPASGIEPVESGARINLVRSFLEREGAFRVDEGEGYLFGKFAADFQGIHLPEDVLTKIYAGNFERLAGKKPRKLDPGVITAECDRLISIIPVMGASQPGQTGDISVAETVKTYFDTQQPGRKESE